jgi:hypothetical protein
MEILKQQILKESGEAYNGDIHFLMQKTSIPEFKKVIYEILDDMVNVEEYEWNIRGILYLIQNNKSLHAKNAEELSKLKKHIDSPELLFKYIRLNAAFDAYLKDIISYDNLSEISLKFKDISEERLGGERNTKDDFKLLPQVFDKAINENIKTPQEFMFSLMVGTDPRFLKLENPEIYEKWLPIAQKALRNMGFSNTGIMNFIDKMYILPEMVNDDIVDIAENLKFTVKNGYENIRMFGKKKIFKSEKRQIDSLIKTIDQYYDYFDIWGEPPRKIYDKIIKLKGRQPSDTNKKPLITNEYLHKAIRMFYSYNPYEKNKIDAIDKLMSYAEQPIKLKAENLPLNFAESVRLSRYRISFVDFDCTQNTLLTFITNDHIRPFIDKDELKKSEIIQYIKKYEMDLIYPELIQKQTKKIVKPKL